MSITTITTRIDRRYLQKKTKDEIIDHLMRMFRENDELRVLPKGLPSEGYYVFKPEDAGRGFNDGCIVWWRQGGHGYSNYIEDAGVFTDVDREKNYPPKEHRWVPVAAVHAAMKTRSYAWLRDVNIAEAATATEEPENA